MAVSKKKPLFNRRYLLILVWVLPVVILLLQRGGGDTSADQIQWNSDLQAYQLPLEQDDIELGLILPLPRTLTDRAWIENRVSVQALTQRLAQPELTDWLSSQGWQAEINQTSTHLRVDIRMEAPPEAQQMDRFYALLSRLSSIESEPIRKRASAERYLQAQKDETRLLAAFGEHLPPPKPTASALLAKPPVWILRGNIPASDDALPTPPTLSRQPANADRQVVLSTSPRQTSERRLLLGQPQLAPTDGGELASQRLAAELMAQLLAQQSARDEKYRWIWKPLAENGYRALLLTSPDTEPSRLASSLSTELFEQTRSSLLERFDQVLADEPSRWLELVALYRLPLDSHRAFRDTLSNLDLDAARGLVSHLLDPGQRLEIRFASTGTRHEPPQPQP